MFICSCFVNVKSLCFIIFSFLVFLIVQISFGGREGFQRAYADVLTALFSSSLQKLMLLVYLRAIVQGRMLVLQILLHTLRKNLAFMLITVQERKIIHGGKEQ